MAELIREFMEFYRLDYTLAIFKPETNLTGEVDRNQLAEKAGLKNGIADSKPILMQLLESFLSGGSGDGGMVLGRGSGADSMKIEPPSLLK